MSSTETSRSSSDVEMDDLKHSSTKGDIQDFQEFKLTKYQVLIILRQFLKYLISSINHRVCQTFS